ncbi:histidinol-phosphate transaminase [Ochrobactrum sp. Marseille-Q0166]|uniref:histidinol-phosphate transaminase n=1 Tax=Ochrobactrum sp. Marseille-Q0166 TaxID=2761105 RepID=UPI0016559B12|nr:histidinol-phosphate transaminase [Ochrobactrum sp. Marseille-Q0166]MBC8719558.1 histidinol-phosphate transaminase [Ochrobactrum sp. Marseille-Q0166]
MSRFWSPFVETLLPYVPGEQPKGRKYIKLNTNENPYGPSPRALAAIRAATDDDLRLYPDPKAEDLCDAIATTLGLPSDSLFIGNGSDEVLAHAFNAFFRGKGPVLFPDVTYSFYLTYCNLYALPFRQIPLDHAYKLVPDDYNGPCGGIVIANPNAPTGIAMDLDNVERILRQNPDVVVVLDEAYVDFGAESAVRLTPRYDNLLVTQTFSKSRSLAGLRVGFAVGQPHLIEALRRVKDSFNSYPLDRLALAGAIEAWRDREWFDVTRKRIIGERDRTTAAMSALGFEVLPSATNFLFVSHREIAAEELFASLRSQGILVRHFRQPRTAGWLRITVGTKEECEALLDAAECITSGRRSV